MLDQRWDAIKAHRTQISDDNPFVRFGKEAWAEYWHREAFVRRETRVPAPDHETDLFEGLDGPDARPLRLGRRRAARGPDRRTVGRCRGHGPGTRASRRARAQSVVLEQAHLPAGLVDDSPVSRSMHDVRRSCPSRSVNGR